MIITLISAGLLILGIISAKPASADMICSGFGMYTGCINYPGYQEPAPTPPLPPKQQICLTIAVTSFVLSWVPTTAGWAWVVRTVSIPSLICSF